VRYIEGLQARREELRCWDISEFLEMRREAMAAAGMALDDNLEAMAQMENFVHSYGSGWAGRTVYQTSHLESDRVPAFNLWCCSAVPPDGYSPFVQELEHVCQTDSEVLPNVFERRPPCSFSPRQVVRREPCQSFTRDVCV